MDANGRTIGTLAREVGIHVETVRYYEQRGLLKQPRRTGGWRRYDDEALRVLRFVSVPRNSASPSTRCTNCSLTSGVEKRANLRPRSCSGGGEAFRRGSEDPGSRRHPSHAARAHDDLPGGGLR